MAPPYKFSVNYTKQKLLNLSSLENSSQEENVDATIQYKPFQIRHLQHYNPTYSWFFELTPQNYNRISLNHPYHIHSENQIYDLANDTVIDKPIFIKFAPLLDPIRYMIGKYTCFDSNTGKEFLPQFGETADPTIDDKSVATKAKINGPNNASYVDCFFSFLNSQLLHHHRFVHGIDFYGSFLGIQEKYRMNVVDDLEYLQSSMFFKENLGDLFDVDDEFVQSAFHDMNQYGSKKNKNKLQIDNNDEDTLTLDVDELLSDEVSQEAAPNEETELVVDYEKKSRSTRSSVSTHSSSNSSLNYSSDHDSDDEDDDDNSSNGSSESEWTDAGTTDAGTTDAGTNDTDPRSNDDSEDTTFAYIKNFPVQMICMEKCDGTLDELFVKDKVGVEQGASALFQVIMTLITYQKVFQFTHNDLHTNNIMYVNTAQEFLYYKYNGKQYRVPTYGRIFKIIDFGRGIYKFKGKQFCSDSFAPGGDAATQYNFEPFMNKKKPRLEPNYSFDLCRLGTSIYDFIIDDEDTDDVDMNELQETIDRWCQDDAGKNVLYKKNGEERYPNFKLYKMIARTVHNHTPQNQLEFPFFSQFEVSGESTEQNDNIMNLDEMPSYC